MSNIDDKKSGDEAEKKAQNTTNIADLLGGKGSADMGAELSFDEDELAELPKEQLVAMLLEVKNHLSQTAQQAVEFKDKFLRASADIQNIQRRASEAEKKASQFGQKKLASEILSVIDNLELAVEASTSAESNIDAIRQGVELTLKDLLSTLERSSIEIVNPMGEDFDPQIHEAMAMVESPGAKAGTIIQVLQKGYTLHGRLLRPARVVVAKASNA